MRLSGVSRAGLAGCCVHWIRVVCCRFPSVCLRAATAWGPCDSRAVQQPVRSKPSPVAMDWDIENRIFFVDPDTNADPVRVWLTRGVVCWYDISQLKSCAQPPEGGGGALAARRRAEDVARTLIEACMLLGLLARHIRST